MNYDDWKLATPDYFLSEDEPEPKQCKMCYNNVEDSDDVCRECIALAIENDLNN